MRGILAIGCCAAYLLFGLLAGASHMHEARDHHAEMRGLHFDHTHLGEPSAHQTAGHRAHAHSHDAHDHTHDDHAHPYDGIAEIDTSHVDHHLGDTLYLTVAAQRAPDSGLRVLPALVAVGATIERPSRVSLWLQDFPEQLRGPPTPGTTPSRAPPA